MSSHNASDQAVVAVPFDSRKSPAQELPPELITLMAKFLIRSPQPRRCNSPSTGHCIHNLRDLLTAAQVCQKWHESIINDARLWTEIEFTGQAWHERDVEALSGVLVLSKNLPLHIGIDFGDPSAASEAAFEQILGISSRCASLDLRIASIFYTRFVNRAALFPILRRLFFRPLQSSDPTEVFNFNEGCTLWNCVPALEQLEINFLGGWVHPFPTSLRLKRVKIDINADPNFYSTTMLLDLLGNSKMIRRITFNVKYAPRQVLETPSVIVTSSRLEALWLTRDAFRLLAHICLPGLRKLLVDTQRRSAAGPQNAIPVIIDFLGRSNPPLTEFVLRTDGEDALLMMPSMLFAMPLLKVFNLVLNPNSEHEYLTAFFDKLARNDDGVFEVLPCLERLRIVFCPRSDQSDTVAAVLINEVDRDHFVEMVRVRTASPNPRLRLVEARIQGNGYCNLEESDLCMLQQYERRVDGLKINIHDARNGDF